MSAAEVIVLIFSICNSLRLFAYLPQLISVLRDRNGASSVSLTTWSLFTLANGSTTAYALVIVSDLRMAVLFAFNTAFSFAIAFGTILKRRLSKGVLAGGSPPVPS